MEDLEALVLSVTTKKDGKGSDRSESEDDLDIDDGEEPGLEDDEEDVDDGYGLVDDDDDDDNDDDYDSKPKAKRKRPSVKTKRGIANRGGGRSSKSRPTKGSSKAKQSNDSLKYGDKHSSFDRDDDDDGDGDVDDDDTFHFRYDEQGYGDSLDREELSRKGEVDREKILTERQEQRSSAYMLWAQKRKLKARGDMDDGQAGQSTSSVGTGRRISGRARSSSKLDALDDLAEDRRKKARTIDMDISNDSERDTQRNSYGRGNDRKPFRGRRSDGDDDYRSRDDDMDIDDDDDENDRDRNKGRDRDRNRDRDRDRGRDRDGRLKEEAKEESELLKEEGPELCYNDIVRIGNDGRATTTPLFIRRDLLNELSQRPYFARVITGLYVRLRVNDKHNESSYLLCRIAGIQIKDTYDLINSDGNKTNRHLVLQSGKQRCAFQINLVSGSHPTETEFNAYVERAKRGGIEIPRREEVKKLQLDARRYLVERNVTATKEESKEHMANLERVYPARVNWTSKRTEIQTEMDIKKQEMTMCQHRGRMEEAHRMQKQLEEMEIKAAEIREMEAKYVFQGKKSNAEVFQSLAKRNQKLNATNESLAASRRNYESNRASIDLYSRFDATGQSYFHIGADGGSSGPLSEQAKDVYTGFDWRKNLRSWNPKTSKQKVITENGPMDPAFDIELPSLEVFVIDNDKPIKPRKPVSSVPPGLDAVYSKPMKAATAHPPKGAKILSFDDWSRHRGT